jgi:hypothetical protein
MITLWKLCATRCAEGRVALSKEPLLVAHHRAALASPEAARQAHAACMNRSTGQTGRPDPDVVAPSGTNPAPYQTSFRS